MAITWDNYEEYILLHADGELDEAAERELMGFVTKHPELRAELEAYESVRLVPDASITFSAKESLLREEPKATRVISFGGWRQYSAAAGIILVLLLAARWMIGSNQESVVSGQPSVAINQTVPDTNQPLVKEQPIAKLETQQPATVTQKTPPALQRSIALQQHPAQQKTIAKEETPTPEPHPEQQRPKQVDIAANPTQPQPEPTITTDLTPQAIPQTEIPQPQESRFLASLPMSEEKRAGLENLRDNLTEKLAKAKSIRKEVKDVSIALKLGNKELRLF